MQNIKCKTCRRLGVKLCYRNRCSIVRKPYPPGQKGKRRVRPLSEYGKELREKQKLKNWYNLKEKQFRKYVKEILQRGGRAKDPSLQLVKILESRLDNVVFRLGFGSSRPMSRQMISHKHFLVNDKLVNIPGYLVKKEDKVSINKKSTEKNLFQSIATSIEKHTTPAWLKLDVKKLEGKVIGQPCLEEVALPVEISAIFEYYSR